MSIDKSLACHVHAAYSWVGMDFTLIVVVVVALFFDFTNGFHDTANAIATTVSTKAISPKLAVLTAAILNFAGAFFIAQGSRHGRQGHY